MGIYVYSMRKPVKNVAVGNTEDVYPIARLQFLIKTSDVSGNRMAKMQVANCEDRFPGTLPRFVVLGDKWENGMDVYRWMGKKPWAYDTPSLPYYWFGTLNLPVLRVMTSPWLDMPFRYIEGEQMFGMKKPLLDRFNAEIINQPFIADEYRKGVTDYTTSDLFKMDEFGEFSIYRRGVKYKYRVNHLPTSYEGMTVVGQMEADRDITNELEAIYS